MRVRPPASLRLFTAAAISAAIYLFLAPLPARAENLIIFHSADQQYHEPPPPQPYSVKQARLPLDNDGNIMVRFHKLSVTFVYDAGGSPQDNRMRPNIPREEVASLGGLSVRLGVSF